MKLSHRIPIKMENIENRVFFIWHCEDTVEAFFENLFAGSKVEDSYILCYEKKKYEIVRLEPIGVELQRDIRIYKLIEMPL